MNKVERVRAALAGAEVDRVPASFWYHFPRPQAQGTASVKAHLDYYGMRIKQLSRPCKSSGAS